SGPNGLSAAIELARHGHSVTVYEANDTVGGGCRSAELTLPGFIHDLCSAFHPMGAASPFFRELDLTKEGLEWIEPPVALAHPLDDGTAVLLERSVDATAAGLGPDGRAYRRLVEPLVGEWDDLAADALGARLRALGGTIETGRRVGSIAELPTARAYLCDVTPRQLDRIAGQRLSDGYRKRLRAFRYGPGVFKLDYAIDGPIPWRA